jgi:hypothetical protein
MRPTSRGALARIWPLVFVMAGTPASGAVVVVYQDPVFVEPPFVLADTDDRDDPVAHIERGLELADHSVVALADSAAASFSAALATADVLLVAPLREDLGAVIDPAAATAIETFVSNGGGLVIHPLKGLSPIGEYPFSFLDAVFGIAGLALDGGIGGTYLRTAAADTTAFSNGPDEVLGHALTRGAGISTGSLPPGALSLYEAAPSGNGPGTVVARFAHGGGRIIYLGYSWEFAWPFRHLDYGWVEALGRAIDDVLGCGDPGAADGDGDGIADACDNCPATNHAVNADCDEDGTGDVCDGDTVDADGDGRDDACDPCVNVAGARTLERSTLRIKSAAALGALDLKGFFALPAGSSFADINPFSSRIRIRAGDDVGRVVFDATLPGVPFSTQTSIDFEEIGWRVNDAKTQWSYNRGMPNFPWVHLLHYGGIQRAKLRDASRKSPGLVKLVIKARNWSFDAAGVAPIRADVAVGDASLGRCTETAFAAADCTVGTNITTCK